MNLKLGGYVDDNHLSLEQIFVQFVHLYFDFGVKT